MYDSLLRRERKAGEVGEVAVGVVDVARARGGMCVATAWAGCEPMRIRSGDVRRRLSISLGEGLRGRRFVDEVSLSLFLSPRVVVWCA